MRRGSMIVAVSALSTLFVAGGNLGWAQPVTPLSGPETQFVADAIREGLAEVEIGKTVAQKAAKAEVKQFAERMVRDHSTMNDRLMSLAKKHKIEWEGTYGTPPLRPDEQAVAKQRELANMSGDQLDKAFMKNMVEDHEKSVRQFKEQVKNAKDEELRTFASTTLPLLEAHLEMARALAGQVGATR